jgi:ABC-type dipeptide/oligopeptide/nickel transport system permease component
MGFLLRRFAAALLSLLVASVLICFMIRLLPGDPVAENMKDPTPKKVAEARAHLGLDKPWWAQYFVYMSGVLRGDLGKSFITNQSVMRELLQRWPATVELALAAMVLATVGGVALGIFSASHRGTWWDALGTTVSLVGLSVPVFWLGLLAILAGTYWLGWFPSMGRLSDLINFPGGGFLLVPSLAAGRWDAFVDATRHLVLPALTLATIPGALIARVTRAAVVQAMEQDFIRTARAKGASEKRVLFRHALRAAAVPVVTMTGVEFAYLLGGAVLTETVFSWPGVGLYITNAILTRDYPAVQGALLCLVTMVMVFNLVVDALHAWLDPRTHK